MKNRRPVGGVVEVENNICQPQISGPASQASTRRTNDDVHHLGEHLDLITAERRAWTRLQVAQRRYAASPSLETELAAIVAAERWANAFEAKP